MNELMSFSKDSLDIMFSAGIYAIVQECKKLVYVGKTECLMDRVKQHRNNSSNPDVKKVIHNDETEFKVLYITNDTSELDDLEAKYYIEYLKKGYGIFNIQTPGGKNTVNAIDRYSDCIVYSYFEDRVKFKDEEELEELAKRVNYSNAKVMPYELLKAIKFIVEPANDINELIDKTREQTNTFTYKESSFDDVVQTMLSWFKISYSTKLNKYIYQFPNLVDENLEELLKEKQDKDLEFKGIIEIVKKTSPKKDIELMHNTINVLLQEKE